MLRNGLIAAAFAVLAIVAVAGWSRKTNTTAATAPSYAQPNSVQPAYAEPSNGAAPATGYSAPAAQPASYDAYGRPVYASQPAYGSNATSVSCVDSYGNPVAYRQAIYTPDSQYVSDHYVQRIHRPVVVRRTDYVERDRGYSYADREVIRRPRSTKKSVAIVAGSAAGGAAIGALAGGGKGAGIGALVGGAGGFIYDRLTHNHR